MHFEFESPLIQGTLLKRYKRFFADVELPSGEIVIAHVPNTGRMTNCYAPGDQAFLSPSDNPKRKLKYTLEMVNHANTLVGVNTSKTNAIVEKALLNRDIPELQEFDHFKRAAIAALF